MDPSIEKLIELVRESGSISLKEKNVILKKARETGEDVDMVEMILESIPEDADSDKEVQKTNSNIYDNTSRIKKRCPNCGAVLSDFVLQCPECSYVFSSESAISERNRDYVAELYAKLVKIDRRSPRTEDEKEFDHIFDDNKAEEKARVIRAFSVPNTKEALIQAFVSCFSSYQGSQNEVERSAWLAKSKEFQLLLDSQPGIDSKTLDLINKYKNAIVESQVGDEKKKRRALVILVFFFIIIILLIILGICSEP